MSNRTCVELNHDYCPRDEKLLEWAKAMQTYMRSGDARELPQGVAFKHLRHHSELDPCVRGEATTAEPASLPAQPAGGAREWRLRMDLLGVSQHDFWDDMRAQGYAAEQVRQRDEAAESCVADLLTEVAQLRQERDALERKGQFLVDTLEAEVRRQREARERAEKALREMTESRDAFGQAALDNRREIEGLHEVLRNIAALPLGDHRAKKLAEASLKSSEGEK